MDRPPPHQLISTLGRLRADALAIAASGIAAVSPRTLVPPVADRLRALDATAVHVVAVGKAAAGMFEAFTAAPSVPIARALVIAPHRPDGRPLAATFVEGGHPYANEGSVQAGELALALARVVPADGVLLCLLSGGASALMAAPMAGVTLASKQRTVAHVMRGGADIGALNAVRKHLSRVKGGRLAAACRGRVVTVAISDVIGDDLSVIGSGPCVPDGSTWQDAASAVRAYGGWAGLDPDVQRVIEAGCRGELPETPKSGDPQVARSSAEVIGGRGQAMEGARKAAEIRGYLPVVIEGAVVGESRAAALHWWDDVARLRRSAGRVPVAIVSSGETTVRVRGEGRGGRNQEFALALVDRVADASAAAVLASVGTDGVDGPTDAAGAIVDSTTRARAAHLGQSPAAALEANDSYRFFEPLGDLVRTGPSGTNVGDLQVLLLDPS